MLASNTSERMRMIPLSVNFDSPGDYLIFIYQLSFATSTVLVAGTVVVSICTSKTLRAHNRFIFMLNTSICDTLVGLSVYYQGLFDVSEGYPYKNSALGFLQTLLGVNILAFLFAQFDRYFAVCRPFFYSRFITKPLVICVNIWCWLYTIAIQVVSLCLPVSKAMQMFVFGVIALQLVVLTKVVMTIKLFIVARHQVEREPPGAEKENKKESLRIIVFVVISFLVLWYPSFVNVSLRLVNGGGLTFRNEATNLFTNLARLNSLCTSSVYLWGSAALRRAAMETIWGRVCPRCKRRVGACRRAGLRKALK